jgi:hypothetical protein
MSAPFITFPIPTVTLDTSQVTATGSATARNLNDRFADVVNVADFGAVGDGITDDSGAINAAGAFAQANGKTSIAFPSGKTFYLKAGPILTRQNVVWEGNGSTITTDQAYPIMNGMFANPTLSTMVQIGNVTADIVGPTNQLPLDSVAGLNIGDWVLCRLGQDPYDAGEQRFVTVARVVNIVGITITIDRLILYNIFITTSYTYIPSDGTAGVAVVAPPVGSKTVYKLQNDFALNVTFRNFVMQGPPNKTIESGFSIQVGVNLLFENIIGNPVIMADMGAGLIALQYCQNVRISKAFLGSNINVIKQGSKGGMFDFAECYDVVVDTFFAKNLNGNSINTEACSDDIFFKNGTIQLTSITENQSPFYMIGLLGISHVVYENLTIISDVPSANIGAIFNTGGTDAFATITGVFAWRGPMANVITYNRLYLDCIFDYINGPDGYARVDFSNKNRHSVKIPLSPNMSAVSFQIPPEVVVQLYLYASTNVDPATVTSFLIDGFDYKAKLLPGQIVNIAGVLLAGGNSGLGAVFGGFAALNGTLPTAGIVTVTTNSTPQAPGNFIGVTVISAKTLESGLPQIKSSAGATPATIFGANLMAWYKADAGVTGTNPITAWADQSGNGRNMSVSFGGPVFGSTKFNGKQGIKFQMADGLASTAFNISSNVVAFFLVGNFITSVGSDARILAYYDPASFSDFNVVTSILLDNFGGSGGSTPSVTVYQNSVRASPLQVISGSNARIYCSYNGSTNTVTMALNNQTPVVSTGFGNNTLGTATNVLAIGRNTAAASNDIMTVAEIVMVNVIPTTQNLTDLDAYFTSKWGITNPGIGTNLLYPMFDGGMTDLLAAERTPYSGGTFVANGATPVTVANANVAITDVIMFSLNTVGGTVGAVPTVKTITAGTGFTVAATAADTSTYNYVLIKNV